jgi:hypothetical protein
MRRLPVFRRDAPAAGVEAAACGDGRPQRANVLLASGTLAVGLLLDRASGLAGQVLVGVLFWAVFFHLLRTTSHQWRLPFYACLIWATAGEIFLSLVWGLYSYRLENIPFFIPPGHVLLFYLGLVWAPRVPRWLIGGVPVLAVGYAAVAAWYGFDTMSILLVGTFVLCMLRQEGRRLYAAMFVLALALELYGTALGIWTWHPAVPYLGLSSLNPPLAAGVFYCVLDMLVAMSARSLLRPSQPHPSGLQLKVS